MAELRNSKRPTWFLFFRLGCVGFGAVFVIFLFRLWIDPSGVQARNSASAGSVVQSLPANSFPIQDNKRDLELLEKEIATQDRALAGERDELTRITDISKTLITVAGVFAFLLGAGSWKLFEDQQKAARETLEAQKEAAQVAFDAEQRAAKHALEEQQNTFATQIRNFISASEESLNQSLQESQASLKQVSALRDEVERDFPMFGRMRSNFQRILLSLEATCSRLSDEDETYTQLRWDEVQQILYYENAISTALLLDTREQSGQLAEIYRLLGVFYGSRFACDKNGKIGSAERDDLNRARFYFDRAIGLDPQNYLAQFDAGYFTQFTDDLVVARASRDYFYGAAVLGSQYQKPLISIALLELEAFKDADAALSALDRAAERKEYNPERLGKPAVKYISYLRSCALCLKFIEGQQVDRATLQDAMATLSTACGALSQFVCSNFSSDTASFFYVLKDNQTTSEAFRLIAEKVNSSDPQALPGYN